MTPALSTIACARVRSASAAARRASQISSVQKIDVYISDPDVSIFIVRTKKISDVGGSLKSDTLFKMFSIVCRDVLITYSSYNNDVPSVSVLVLH